MCDLRVNDVFIQCPNGSIFYIVKIYHLTIYLFNRALYIGIYVRKCRYYKSATQF